METREMKVYQIINETGKSIISKSKTDREDALAHMMIRIAEENNMQEEFNEELLQTIKYYRWQFSEDGIEYFEKDSCAETAQEIMKAITWRLGLLSAILYAAGKKPKANKYKALALFIKKINSFSEARPIFTVPDEKLIGKTLKVFENATGEKIEAVAIQILKELDCETELYESGAVVNILDYGHPIDSSIVKMLDMPIINDVFNALVNMSADAEMGQMLATSIPVNESSYPEINSVVEDCVKALNINRPYVVVTNQIPGINAVTFGNDEKPYIAISSLLVKLMKDDSAKLRFVIGHECGHIAMGHVVYHTAATTLGNLSQYIPIIGPAVYSLMALPLNAWSRRSEITADRAGLICCGDLEKAQRTLLQLESAFMEAEKIDIETYLEKSKDYLSHGVLRKIGEYGTNHPLTPKRIEALTLFAQSETYAKLCEKDVTVKLTKDELNKKVEERIRVLGQKECA